MTEEDEEEEDKNKVTPSPLSPLTPLSPESAGISTQASHGVNRKTLWAPAANQKSPNIQGT